MIRPDHLMSRSFGSGMFHTDIFRFRGVRSPEPSEFASLDLLRSPQDRRQNKRAPIKAPNTKHQTPKKLQVPNTKHQAPNSREAPSSKRGPWFGAWNLGFLWCLQLGFWCFDSGISLELGVWCLVFRSAAAQKLRYAHHRPARN